MGRGMGYDNAVVGTYLRLLAQRGALPFDSDVCRRMECALSLFHEIWPIESKIALRKLSGTALREQFDNSSEDGTRSA